MKKSVCGFSNYRVIIMCGVLLCLPACQQRTKEHAAINAPIDGLVYAARIPEPAVSAPAPKDPLGEIESSLLRRAELAFRAGRFTSPSHDNAYDKFHSVLLLNPDNRHARAGLQAILLRYSQLIRAALAEGRLRAATNYLRQVEIYYPANSLLMELKQQLALARLAAAKPAAVVAEKNDPAIEEISLPAVELSAKSQAVVDTLAGIATRLRDTEESVLIYARSDREGRWIYKQLKQSASGYRVRGDIRISRIPKIRIMPPL